MPRTSSRRSAGPFVAAAVVAGLLTVLVALLLPRGSAPSSEGTSPSSAAASDPARTRGLDRSLVGLQAVLDRRATAALAGDRVAWMRDVDTSVPGLRHRQEVLLDGLRALPVDQLRWTVTGPGRRRPGWSPGCTPVTLQGSWRLRGVDTEPVTFERTFCFRREEQRWLLVEDRDDQALLQAFELPGVRAVPSPSGLVVGNAADARLAECAVALRDGRRRAEQVWGRPRTTPVVVVPATVSDYVRLTGRSPGAARQVAAETFGLLREGRPALGDRVVVNPDAFARLTPQGRTIVLAHETFHLLVRGSTGGRPPEWLSEGLAVHVSYRGLDVDVRRTAPELLAAARSRRGPTGPPSDDRFAGEGTGTAYDEAWLLVAHLVRQRGEEQVVAAYRDLAQGSPREELWRRLGTTEAEAVAGWQADLRRLARP